MVGAAYAYLRVVKFQWSCWFLTLIFIYGIHWMLEINRWSLSWAKHKTNHPTEMKSKINIKWIIIYFTFPILIKITWKYVPWICRNSSPSIVNRSFKNVATIWHDVLNYIHMKPYAFCLSTHNSSWTKSLCNWPKEGLFK